MPVPGWDDDGAPLDVGVRAKPLRAVPAPPPDGDAGFDAVFGVDGAGPEGDGREAQPKPSRAPTTPADVIERWRIEGPLVRLRTGIRALDDLCRGGFPIPWRVFIVGAPSAGKTFVDVIIGDHLSSDDDGLCVGLLAVDEEDDDIVTRLVQIAGFTVKQAEGREHDDLDRMRDALARGRVRIYDASYTIAEAAADLAAWAASQGRRAGLFVDSIQTVRPDGPADTPRLAVEANVRAVRAASTDHRMLVVATSEANRASYRGQGAEDESNDLAAGAESRALEYGAQTQLMLRTPKDHPEVIHVRVAKNRRATKGEFWLRMDREAHSVTEIGNPAEDPSAAAKGDEKKREKNRGGVTRDARDLIPLVRARPGIGEVALRVAVKAAGLTFGRERLGAALEVAAEGIAGVRIVDRGTDKGDKHYPAYFVEAMPAEGGSDD